MDNIGCIQGRDLHTKPAVTHPFIFSHGFNVSQTLSSDAGMIGDSNQFRRFDSLVLPSIYNLKHHKSETPLLADNIYSGCSRTVGQRASPEDSPDSDVTTCVTSSDGSCDSQCEASHSCPPPSANRVSDPRSASYNSGPQYFPGSFPSSFNQLMNGSADRVHALRVPKPEHHRLSDRPSNRTHAWKSDSFASSEDTKPALCSLNYVSASQITRADVSQDLIPITETLSGAHVSRPQSPLHSPPSNPIQHIISTINKGKPSRLPKPEPSEFSENLSSPHSKSNPVTHASISGRTNSRQVCSFNLNQVDVHIIDGDFSAKNPDCDMNQDITLIFRKGNIGKESCCNLLRDKPPMLMEDDATKVPGLPSTQARTPTVRRKDAITTPMFILNESDTPLDSREDFSRSIVPVCYLQNFKKEPCKAIVPVDHFQSTRHDKLALQTSSDDMSCHSERTYDDNVECSSVSGKEPVLSDAVIPFENYQNNRSFHLPSQRSHNVGSCQSEGVHNGNITSSGADRQSVAQSRPRPRPRVLPTVGAFAVQCSLCMKWRLVPSQQLYEQIRQSIIEKPFYCTSASLWRPGASCDDPPELTEDKKCIWAIDKPNIPVAPKGWKRLLVIRGAGASKFADVYYLAPNGKKLRSMPDVERFLMEYPEYLSAGVTLNQFSFVIPKSLDENYCRRKTPTPSAPSQMRGSISHKKTVNDQLRTKYQPLKRSTSDRTKTSFNAHNYVDSLALCKTNSTDMPIAAQPLCSSGPLPYASHRFWSNSNSVQSQPGMSPWSLLWMN